MRKVKKKKQGIDLKEKLSFGKKKKTDIKEKDNINKKKKEDIKEKDNLVKKKESDIKEKNKINKKKVSDKKETNKIEKKAVKKHHKKEKTHNQKTKRRIWKKILTFILILGIVCVLSIAAFLGYVVISAPKFDEAAFEVKDQTVVYDINGNIIAKLGVEKRESVSYDELPQVLIDAIIATEDSRYFQHNGVDLPRFTKATLQQLVGIEAGGASTLTMQVVKNNLTKKQTIEKNMIEKIVRKFQDVYLSVFKVEKEYTKEEIIELYVNNYYLGGSVYGVDEASKYYFGKPVSELTLPEASLIAGLFQAPGRHDPYKNIESATNRRNTVLKLMVRHGYITQEEADLANSISIESLLVGVEGKTEYQGYIDYVSKEVLELTGMDPSSVPMKIYTTMEKEIQDGINNVMSDNDANYWKDKNTQAGIAIVNVKTGAIAALSGQRNNSDAKIFSYSTEALRQPGSTAKPIFAYGPGFEYLNNSTYTLFVDEPWSYTNGPSINNWDGKFEGIITTRRALQVSRNIPALKAYQQVGSKKIQQFAYSLGLDVSYNQNSENYRIVNKTTGLDNTINEAYSIGGVSEGFSPLMMAAAYSAFASGGYYTKPYSVTKIEFRETGETIEYKPAKTRVMKDSTAYLMNNVLESAVTSGFNGGAYVSGSHVAAKTGTSNFPDNVMKEHKLPGHAVNDLWTVAYTSEYSIGVWYGYKDVTVGYNTDGAYKDRLVKNVMKYIPKDKKGWKMPSSVVASKVEKESYPAKLPSEYTPAKMITTEYFVRGTQPTEVSDRYAKLNDVSNAQVTMLGNTATITWEYVIPNALSDDYLDKYFSQSVFKNAKEDLIADRKKYNSETLGNIEFGIYKEMVDGTLQLITYTSNLNYTYTATENTTLIIRAEHKNYKTNAEQKANESTGVKLTITANSQTVPETPTNPSETLVATLNGLTTVDTTVGNYTENGIKNILYGITDVTSQAQVGYQLINGSDISDYSSITDLQNKINQMPAGSYKINYVITYNGKQLIKNRTVNLT